VDVPLKDPPTDRERVSSGGEEDQVEVDRRSDVGREEVAGPGVREAQPHAEAGVVGSPRDPPFGGHARPGHFRVVDPAPQVTPIGHVAGLARDALVGIAARLPLPDGVLERLPVGRRFLELVAGGAEPTVLELHRADCPLVRGPRR
jgi:hypothetical protein